MIVQWFIHSDGDRKKEKVEEKNTMDLATGKEKLKQSRQIEAKGQLIRWRKKRATLRWQKDLIYKDWIQECFWHCATLLNHVHENL